MPRKGIFMKIKKIPAESVLYHQDSPLNEISIVSEGCISALLPTGEYLFEKGSILGLLDLYTETCYCDYTSLENSSVISYSWADQKEFSTLLSDNPQIASACVFNAVRQICDLLDSHILLRFESEKKYSYLLNTYEEYKKLCSKCYAQVKALPGLDEVKPLEIEETLDSFLSSYYDSIKQSLQAGHLAPLLKNPDFTTGLLLRISKDMRTILQVCEQLAEYNSTLSCLLLNENGLDYFDLYSSLMYRCTKESLDTAKLSTTISKLMIHIENTPSISSQLYRERLAIYRQTLSSLENTGAEEVSMPENVDVAGRSELSNSLNTILQYSECPGETTSAFKEAILAYKALTDKNAYDDSVNNLRRKITSLFYEIYTAAFFVSMKNRSVPTILNMFLKFGYVDEELAGSENASYMYSIADSYQGDSTRNIYTIYEWLTAIYLGKKEPCRNEFDSDYAECVRELLVTKKIDSKAGAAMLTDQKQKVLFEIKNMFSTTNRMTFGKISTFCPVFSEHEVFKNLSSILATPEILDNAMNKVRSLDYTAYYRDILYSNPEIGINREYVAVEVLPNIILLPNVGTRCVMWQEIEGKKRNSPACMMIPVFSLESVENFMLRLTGEFRYEMCRRIQGSRWNDYSTKSLTSEYYDYIQFYKKNSELSADAKERVKSALAKAKNNYKEMFVSDYTTYVTYEGNALPRMNKVSRKILMTYCPFPKAVQDKLATNPAYTDVLHIIGIQRSKELYRMGNVCKKITNSGNPIPAEILAQVEYLKK